MVSALVDEGELFFLRLMAPGTLMFRIDTGRIHSWLDIKIRSPPTTPPTHSPPMAVGSPWSLVFCSHYQTAISHATTDVTHYNVTTSAKSACKHVCNDYRKIAEYGVQ